MKKTKFKIGDIVRVSPENDNENYNSFRHKKLIVTHVATSEQDHPGYDNSMEGEALYDFEGIDCSLYDYELQKV